MTVNASEALRLYRSRHRIEPVDDRCATDGIRVLSRAGGKLRHHPDDISRLVKNQYGERMCPVCERPLSLHDSEGHPV